MPFKMHFFFIFPQKEIIKKNVCVPTLPKIFISVTRNTLIFLFGPLYVFFLVSTANNRCVILTMDIKYQIKSIFQLSVNAAMKENIQHLLFSHLSF